MENKKKRSPIMVIGFAVLIGFLVIALLNGTIRPSSVVAAKVGLAPGTLLTADLMEVRSVPAGGVPSDAFKAIADVAKIPCPKNPCQKIPLTALPIRNIISPR
jgi:Flp pilus assembly protein CpaB